VTPVERLSHLLRLPRFSVLPSVFAGACAAYDPVLRPQWATLGLFAAFLFAIGDAEGLLAHGRPGRPAPPGAGARFAASLALALVCGALVVALRGWPMFWFVSAATLLATAFIAGPRLAETSLGGPLTILWMGPLATAGASFALTGAVAPPALWIGLPIGFLADAARRAHEAARHEHEGLAVGSTGAIGHDGQPAAPPWFAGDLVAGFGAVPALILAGELPWAALLALVVAPWALREFARARGGYVWREAAVRTRLLHAGFAVALALTTFAARLFSTRAA
jgi:1,4-dihydroxy-2-naphthoate octaprenyltransferase